MAIILIRHRRVEDTNTEKKSAENTEKKPEV
jgi:hypothetical protein